MRRQLAETVQVVANCAVWCSLSLIAPMKKRGPLAAWSRREPGTPAGPTSFQPLTLERGLYAVAPAMRTSFQ